MPKKKNLKEQLKKVVSKEKEVEEEDTEDEDEEVEEEEEVAEEKPKTEKVKEEDIVEHETNILFHTGVFRRELLIQLKRIADSLDAVVKEVCGDAKE